MKICIDAGHYGKYNRSPVNGEYYESDFSWKFSLLLKAELEKRGVTVITTRADKDKDMELTARGRKSSGCDLFLSIHSNACDDANADYPLACCCVSGTADVIGHELAEVVAKCMNSTGKARIWKRVGNGGADYYGVLRGAAAVGVPGVLLEHGFHTNLKNTNWLLNDANLQAMAEAEANKICEHFGVTAQCSATPTQSNTNGMFAYTAEQYIWKELTKFLTDEGTAGLMGNLKAESNLEPENLQNTFEKKLGYTDTSYTEAVDSGAYKNFENDGAGYGIAQWTYHTRKASLLEYAKSKGTSIGNLGMQVDFLIRELQTDYKVLYNTLKTTKDIKTASDSVLTQFERPADMGNEVKNKRYKFAKEIYDANHRKETVQNVVKTVETVENSNATEAKEIPVSMTINGVEYSGVLKPVKKV